MPQLNPEFFVSQLFWLVVTFSFLLIFLWRISLPRISTVLEKRESKINNDMESAKQLQAEAEGIQEKIDQSLNDAKESTSQSIKNALNKFNEEANLQLNKVDSELIKKIEESSKLIDESKKKALSEINEEIITITKLTLSKLSSLNVSDAEIRNSLDDINNQDVK